MLESVEGLKYDTDGTMDMRYCGKILFKIPWIKPNTGTASGRQDDPSSGHIVVFVTSQGATRLAEIKFAFERTTGRSVNL